MFSRSLGRLAASRGATGRPATHASVALGSCRPFPPTRGGPAAVPSARSLHSLSASRKYALQPPNMPFTFTVQYDKPYAADRVIEFEEMPRDEFGVPAHIPPELAAAIQHTYFVPPQFYPFLKKLGDQNADLKPYMDKLIAGQMTFHDYEEMFYRFASPIKIYRNQFAMPYRTEGEVALEGEVKWESAMLNYRGKVVADLTTITMVREWAFALMGGVVLWVLYFETMWWYRMDMKLFYIEAPEHKINWVVPRGDL